MLPIALGLFTGGAAVIGVKASKKRKKQPLVDVLNGIPPDTEEKPLGIQLTEAVSRQSPALGKWLSAMGNTLAKRDADYQEFVMRRIDPLLAGKQREQFFKALSAGRETTLTENQKAINRQMAAGVGALTLIGLGHAIGVSLAPVVIIMGLYLSLPVYKVAYEMAVKERRLSTVHLMAVYFSVLWLGGYYAVGTLGLLLGALSQKIMHICEDSARYQLVNVFQQHPRSVWVLTDGIEIEIPFEQLQAGNTLVLDVGQTIPVDGVIVDGLASIDQHMLTGESQPIDKGVGDTVLASTVVLGGRLFVRVDKTGAETSAARIGEILNRGTEYQLSMGARAMKITDRTLIPMLAVSALSIPITGFKGAAAVLGSNLTMNMVWLRLLTLLNFLNAASRHGILVKDGSALERLKTIDTVVFDKTGTLTLEQPHVLAVHPCEGYGGDAVLTLAAAAEHRQVHPVALAILAAAKERQLDLPAVDEAQYDIGFGIKVKLSGRQIYVGSRRFMDEENIEIPAAMHALESSCSAQGHSLVYVASDGVAAGMIELQATTRPEALDIVRGLHERGIKLYIISGDSELPTQTLARELGIDGYFANTLPERKADLVRQLQEEGRNVCFVGDGINDAIALRQANVSVSLGGATTAATDTAQVVLMDAGLKQLLTLLDLSHALNDNINRNFTWAAIMSFISVGGILFFHGGFLMVEIMAGIQSFNGIAIASRPLLGDGESAEKPGLLGKPSPLEKNRDEKA